MRRPGLLGRHPRLAAGLAAAVLLAAVGVAVAFWSSHASGSAGGGLATLKASSITTATGGSGTASLSWSSVTPPGSGSITYFVTRDGGTPAGTCASSGSPSTATSCTDSAIPAGVHSYAVTAVWRTWTAKSSAVNVTVASSPAVTSTSPSSRGQGAANQTITINGSGFLSGASASFGSGVTVNSTTFKSATQLTASITVASSGEAGSRTVTITNPDGGVGSRAAAFTVNAGPVVESVSPGSRGQGAAGQTITIKGTGFASGAVTTFSGSGVTVASTTFISSTEITASVTVEAGAATGARTATVTNTDAGVGSLAGAFTVNAKPTITSTSPASRGQGAASQTVKIAGTGFSNGAPLAATFSGTGITVISTSFVSSTEITVNITLAANATTGKRTIALTNGDAGTATSGEVFTVTLAPVITSATPNNGDQGGKETVTIKGSNFVTGASATFGAGITVNSTSFVSSTELTASITIEATASTAARTVTVTNPDQGVGSSSAFTVNGAPTATTASPSSRGQGATNQTIKITGTNFEAGAIAATFSGTGITVKSTSFISTTEVTANIDIASNATTGARNITITNPDTTTATITSGLTINLGPTITSPTEAAPGHTGHNLEANINITGTNFVSPPTISFSNVEFSLVGELKFNSSTSLTAKVKESGGNSAKSNITVTNPDGGSATCVNCLSV